MDDPAVPESTLREALAYLRTVNTRLGGWAALRRHLAAWSRRWPKDRPVTLLDVGTGSADIPILARRWARSRGFDLRVTAIDAHHTTISLATEHVRDALDAAGEPADPALDSAPVRVMLADARALHSHFRARSFDYVHAGLFLHHLPDIEVLTVLAGMERTTRAGIIWNDLVRSAFISAMATPFLLRTPPIVRHDARVSFEAGFTRAEALDFARRADITYARFRRTWLLYRFTLAGERPGAWSPAPSA